VGWICVRSSKADPVELESKIYLAEALAGQATLAVQMARLSEQARQAAVLAERNRIARDIHDTLAQGFTGVIVNLEAANRTLRKNNMELAAQHIEHARSLAQSGLAEARVSVGALRPDVSQRVELVEALQALLRRFEASETLHGEVLLAGDRVPLPADVENELLRIAQEGMTNVLKHAEAQRVELRLAFDTDAVRLSIADDGIGFDPTAHHDGFGLLGMRERAERIGAKLHVRSRPRHGTQVETVVPRSALDRA
jgi:signal transduction histidine kinase